MLSPILPKLSDNWTYTTGHDETEKLFPREFYTRDVVSLSKDLLGKIIVRRYDNKVLKAKIVEVEAYAGAVDKGCHAYDYKKSEKNKAMFMKGGHLYVYAIYGANWCINVTAAVDGNPSATLIRAVEIIDGMDHAKANRGNPKTAANMKEISNGPGKAGNSLKLDKSSNGIDVTNTSGGCYIIEGDG